MTDFTFFLAVSNMTLQMSVLIGLLADLQDNTLVLVAPDWSERYLMIGCFGKTAVEYLGGTVCVCLVQQLFPTSWLSKRLQHIMLNLC